MIPFFIISTLKFINNPTLQPDNFRYEINCALCKKEEKDNVRAEKIE